MKNLLLIFLIIFCSCNDDSIEFELPSGTYTGTFVRSNPQVRLLTSTVVLTFTEHTFDGSSTTENYPLICKGSYNITGSEIEFIESCTRTVDTDWSYTLSGKYQIAQSDGEFIISRFNADGIIDNYRLRRQ
jgi:hypothetical protein